MSNNKYSKLPDNEQDHTEMVPFQKTMTHNKAIKILGLSGYPKVETMKQAYDSLFADYSKSVDQTSPRKMKNLMLAYTFLKAELPTSRVDIPIEAMVNEADKAVPKLLEEITNNHKTYRKHLNGYVNTLYEVGLEYCEALQKIGSKIDNEYQVYINKVSAMTEILTNALKDNPTLLVSTRALFERLTLPQLSEFEGGIAKNGGPINAAKEMKNHLDIVYNEKVKEPLEKVLATNKEYLKAVTVLCQSLQTLNKAYIEKIKASSDKAHLTKNTEEYNNAFKQKTTDFNNLYPVNPARLAELRPLLQQLHIDISSYTQSKTRETNSSLLEAEYKKRFEIYKTEQQTIMDKFPQQRDYIQTLTQELIATVRYDVSGADEGKEQDQAAFAVDIRVEPLKKKLLKEHPDLAKAFIPVIDTLFAIKTKREIIIEACEERFEDYIEDLSYLQTKLSDLTDIHYTKVLQNAAVTLRNIGQTYFEAIKHPDADIAELTNTVREEFKTTVAKITTTIAKDHPNIQKEIWPELNPILQCLAKLFFMIPYLIIKHLDENTQTQNKLFKPAQDAIKNAWQQWEMDKLPDFEAIPKASPGSK